MVDDSNGDELLYTSLPTDLRLGAKLDGVR